MAASGPEVVPAAVEEGLVVAASVEAACLADAVAGSRVKP